MRQGLNALFIVALVCGYYCLVSSAQQRSGTQWDGVYTNEQSTRGEIAYRQYCSMCHGSDLFGGEMAPRITGSEFLAEWDDLVLAELFDRIDISMPQNAPGTLSAQQSADILSFVLLKNGAPPGDTELQPDRKKLEGIKVAARRP